MEPRACDGRNALAHQTRLTRSEKKLTIKLGFGKIFSCLQAKKFHWFLPTKFAYGFRSSSCPYLLRSSFKSTFVSLYYYWPGLTNNNCPASQIWTFPKDFNQKLRKYRKLQSGVEVSYSRCRLDLEIQGIHYRKTNKLKRLIFRIWSIKRCFIAYGCWLPWKHISMHSC